jgi:hypothetical protein
VPYVYLLLAVVGLLLMALIWLSIDDVRRGR